MISKFSFVFLALALSWSSQFIQLFIPHKPKTMEVQVKTGDAIINTAFFYLKEGQKANFEKFRSRAHFILHKYGARIERIVEPHTLVQGDINLPDEIHFAYYPNMAAKEAFDQDPEFIELKKKYLGASVEKFFGFITKEDDIDVYREFGDGNKTFGIALVYYKEGKQFAQQFTEYHQEACEIIPEFGAHFEHFLIPFASANEAQEQPDEIHLFYFDSAEGMQQMAHDPRMQKIYPKRDGSLKDLTFILGKAI